MGLHHEMLICAEYEKELKAKDEAYNQLLDQAIRFAETVVAYVPSGLPRAKEAKAFLDRPEVQARREQLKGE